MVDLYRKIGNKGFLYLKKTLRGNHWLYFLQGNGRSCRKIRAFRKAHLRQVCVVECCAAFEKEFLSQGRLVDYLRYQRQKIIFPGNVERIPESAPPARTMIAASLMIVLPIMRDASSTSTGDA